MIIKISSEVQKIKRFTAILTHKFMSHINKTMFKGKRKIIKTVIFFKVCFFVFFTFYFIKKNVLYLHRAKIKLIINLATNLLHQSIPHQRL